MIVILLKLLVYWNENLKIDIGNKISKFYHKIFHFNSHLAPHLISYMLYTLGKLPMTLSALNAISPIDGRYINKTRALSPYFSEFALTYYRLMVEIRWLESLAANEAIPEVPQLDAKAKHF